MTEHLFAAQNDEKISSTSFYDSKFIRSSVRDEEWRRTYGIYFTVHNSNDEES